MRIFQFSEFSLIFRLEYCQPDSQVQDMAMLWNINQTGCRLGEAVGRGEKTPGLKCCNWYQHHCGNWEFEVISCEFNEIIAINLIRSEGSFIITPLVG